MVVFSRPFSIVVVIDVGQVYRGIILAEVAAAAEAEENRLDWVYIELDAGYRTGQCSSGST